MTGRDLRRAVASANQRASFRAARDQSLVRLTPLHPDARQWLESKTTDEATWLGSSLVLDIRYFADLADAIIGAGFRFEGDVSS